MLGAQFTCGTARLSDGVLLLPRSRGQFGHSEILKLATCRLESHPSSDADCVGWHCPLQVKLAGRNKMTFKITSLEST